MLVLGGVRTFAELIEEPPRADEHGEAGTGAARSRFGRYARRLWEGLLACEEIDGAMSAATGSRAFDLGGPLPTGVTVLEASAGTGKTYTIAALAARYVAEGTPLRDLLLVTFTRMATGELRERVRERLVDVEQALADVLAGAPAPARDEVVALLADGAPRGGRAARRARLERALADFDAATIATTHGFCQEVLGGLGVAGDVERGCELVEDVRDLVEEVVDDLYVRRFHRQRRAAVRARRGAADRPASPSTTRRRRSSPPTQPDDSVPAMRRRLAEAVRDELDVRKHRGAVMTYDDLLIRLQATLAGPRGGRRRPPAARALPRRAGRRVPGHRSGPVGHHAPRVRRRRRPRSC